MLICSLNIGAVCAETNGAEYDIKTIDNGNTYAYNISERDVEIYVTDGYVPIAGAEVCLAGENALSDENGIAYFENVPTSDEANSLTASFGEFGERHIDILVPSTQRIENNNQKIDTIKCTVSFWTPDPEQENKLQNMPAPIAAGDTNNWTFVSGGPSDPEIVQYYNGYVYVLSEDVSMAYDLLSGEWITLSHGTGFNRSYNYYSMPIFMDGCIYRFVVSITISGDDEWHNASGGLYRIDLESGNEEYIYSVPHYAIYYNSAIECRGKLFFANGISVRDDGSSINDASLCVYDPSQGVDDCVIQMAFDEIYNAFTYGNSVFYIGKTSDGDMMYRINADDLTYEYFNLRDFSFFQTFSGQSACAASEDKIYIVGGKEYMTDFRGFNFKTLDYFTYPKLTYGRNNAAIYYNDGKIYVIGGYDENNKYVDFMEVYDTEKSTFSTQKIGSGQLEITGGLTSKNGGKLYAAGNGYLGIYNFQTANETYFEPQHIYTDLSANGFDAYRAQTLAFNGNTIYAWGEGYYADGTDSMSIKPTPTQIYHGGKIKLISQVCRGKNHNLVLDSDGNVWGWGSNTNHPMGTLGGKVKTVTKLDNISNVKQIAAGAEFSIFLKNDGTLWGLGKNDVGQLGQGTVSNYIDSPVQIEPNLKFDYVAASEEYVAAITTNGQIYTWGGNMKGQLGNGKYGSATNNDPSDDYIAKPNPVDITLQNGEKFTKISTGVNFCLALTDNGNIYAWGNNESGQLGQGNKINNHKPYKINSIDEITDIAAGRNSAIAVKNNGERVYGWGEGRDGQLGFKVSGSVLNPTEIKSLNGYDIGYVDCGDDYTIMLGTSSADMYSFGSNQKGSLGIY